MDDIVENDKEVLPVLLTFLTDRVVSRSRSLGRVLNKYQSASDGTKSRISPVEMKEVRLRIHLTSEL